jgi:hypothetical protein
MGRGMITLIVLAGLLTAFAALYLAAEIVMPMTRI